MQGEMFTELGKALRTLRESAGFTQAALARKAGIGKSQESKYESGKGLPKLETLGKLLEALGADPLTLFYTAHLLQHRAEIFPASLLMTTTPFPDDPALASFRRLFGHFVEAFQALMATRFSADGRANAGRVLHASPRRNS